jgi:alkylhydroperoxidase family enzyme
VVKQGKPQSQGRLGDRQWAVLRYADAMTTTITLPQQIFDNFQSVGFSQQELVEITATVAAYNLTCRFVLALDVSDGIAAAPDWFKNVKDS